MGDLSKTLTVLSSMISPVVLILASGSLILTTSQRLSRVIERTRALTDTIRELTRNNTDEAFVRSEAASLFSQLKKAASRARLLQRALISLYLTLSVFVATSIAIGIVDISNLRQTWIPIALGIFGAGLLFYASIVLIRESIIAVRAVDQEMNHSIKFFKDHFSDLNTKKRAAWWRKWLSTKTTKP